MANGDGRSAQEGARTTTSDVEVSEWNAAEARLRSLRGDATTIATDAVAARRTIDAIAAFVRDEAEPPAGSGLVRACDDPLVLREIADLHVKLHVAEAVLARATRGIDVALAIASVGAPTAAAIAVAEARVLVTEVVLASGAKRVELAGTPMPPHRSARPTRWTLHAIGNSVLNGVDLPAVAEGRQ